EGSRLSQEAAQLAKQARDIRAAHMKSTSGAMRALSQENRATEKALRPEVRVSFAVNQDSLGLNGEAARLSYPGASLAMRAGDDTFLCFGAWKVAKGTPRQTELKADFKPGRASTTVQNVVVHLTGTPKLVDELLAGLDSRAISSLLAH
ncbi:MAG: hypothetical protein M1541_13130, partial [Acidobacteria bacterium]|nr:hypothetical protein [Acidobacteriota bacterium]